jgi:hypothetical protein
MNCGSPRAAMNCGALEGTGPMARSRRRARELTQDLVRLAIEGKVPESPAHDATTNRRPPPVVGGRGGKTVSPRHPPPSEGDRGGGEEEPSGEIRPERWCGIFESTFGRRWLRGFLAPRCPSLPELGARNDMGGSVPDPRTPRRQAEGRTFRSSSMTRQRADAPQ